MASFAVHVFGHWHGNHLADRFLANPHSVDLLREMTTLHHYRITNTEETHGTVWQFMARLAGSSHDHITLAARICERSRQLGGVTYLECAHGVGHGLFYYHMNQLKMKAPGYTIEGQTVINRCVQLHIAYT